MSEPARVTFKLGGFKRPALNNLASATSQFDTSTTSTNDQQLELVTGFDNGELRGNAPVIKKEELVIPSQPNAHNQFFKMKKENKKKTTSNGMDISQLDDEAKRALVLDAQAANEAWNERDENGPTRVHTIEQDSANTFMTDMNDETHAKETEEEKEVESADYEQVSIEDFGMAVLRGMGYKEDSGLGITNKKQVDVFVPESRPRGLGLGADRKVLEKINQLKRNLKKAGIDEKDDLCFEKGAFVLIEKGPHQDLYGTIESIDEDVTRLTVSLAVSGTNKKKEVISISQYSVKLVTEKEFLKYSKYVNKSKADRVDKETSERLMKDYHRHETKTTDSDDDRDRDHKHRHSSKNDEHDRKHHRHRDDDRNRSRRH